MWLWFKDFGSCDDKLLNKLFKCLIDAINSKSNSLCCIKVLEDYRIIKKKKLRSISSFLQKIEHNQVCFDNIFMVESTTFY